MNNFIIRLNIARKLDSQYGKSLYFDGIVSQETSYAIGKNHQEPRAKRSALVHTYSRRWWSLSNLSIGEEYEKKMTRTESIIQSCINEPNRYINEEFTAENKGDNPLIYLTEKGKQFAGWTGLFSEWLARVEPLTTKAKAVYLAIGFIIGGLITNFNWLIKIIFSLGEKSE